MVYASSKWTCRLWNLGYFAALRVQNKDLWHICDLQKRLTQTWVDSEQNVIEAAIDQWRDRLRSCVRAGGGHFEHMLRN